MKIFRLLVFFFCLSGLSALAQNNAETPVITIIHSNDTHSQIEPEKTRQGKLRGGVIERAAILEYFRLQDPDLLYLDAGDFVQGSPYFNIFDGELETLCLNQQQLVASTLGNHEFDNGEEFLRRMLLMAEFPMISCNYHCEGTPLESVIVPHLILQNHDVKIGITGVSVAPDDLIFARNWAGITYEDPRTAVNREADLLRQEGCDLVIVLSHLGYEAAPAKDHKGVLDSDLAPACHGVDVIIGAHSHTNIEHGVYIMEQENHPVLITQTGGKASPLGYLQITMKEGSRYPGCRYSTDSIVCCKLHPEDYDLNGLGQQMQEYIAPYQELLETKMNVRLAYAPKRLDRGRPESLLGNFTSDAFRIIGEQMDGRKMDASVMNNGGLRSDLPEGDVTLGTLYSIFPFENTITIIDLKGNDLKELIESNAGRGMDSWSGIQVTLDKEGDKRYASEILVGGAPIDTDKLYTICTIDYLAEGNGGMTALTHAVKARNTGVLIRDAMISYVKGLEEEGKQVTAAIDGRIIVRTKQ